MGQGIVIVPDQHETLIEIVAGIPIVRAYEGTVQGHAVKGCCWLRWWRRRKRFRRLWGVPWR